MSFQPSKLFSHCPLCRQAYKEQDIHLLNEDRGMMTFHCHCLGCHRAIMAVVAEQSGLVSSIGILTDLQYIDAKKVETAKSISSDECVHWHRSLQEQSLSLCKDLLLKAKG